MAKGGTEKERGGERKQMMQKGERKKERKKETNKQSKASQF